MKATIESTGALVEVNGVEARIWQGRSEGGVECLFLVTRVMVARDADQAVFQRELAECTAPRPDVLAIPARMIL